MARRLVVPAYSSSFAPRIRSVHALIVGGDRLEISACLDSAQLPVSKGHEFKRIRWSDRISDESVVREYRWVDFQVRCPAGGGSLFL